MKRRVHAVAGLTGLMTILAFWISSVVCELVSTTATVAAVKAMILTGMLILIPAMVVVAASGRSVGPRAPRHGDPA